MYLSYLECHAFRSIGAMSSDRYSEEPSKACRPFNRHHDGFIYGESCGVVVIEKEEHFSKECEQNLMQVYPVGLLKWMQIVIQILLMKEKQV